MIAIKDMTCQELDDLHSNCESIWVKVSIGSKKHAYVGAFYNPESSLEALAVLDSSLSKLQRKSGNSLVYFGGDFSVGGDICGETNTIGQGSNYTAVCETLLEMCLTFSLEQVVADSTRGDRILDLFLTSYSTFIDSVDIISSLGDHDIVRIEASVMPMILRPTKMKIILYSKRNFTDMKIDFLHFSLSFLENFRARSVHENWDILKHKLFSLMEKYIPSKVTSTRYNLPWFNQSLRKLNREVQRLYNVQKGSKLDHDRPKYRHARKIYK